MGRPTYKKLMDLRKKLEENAIGKFRSAAEELKTMLGDAGVRRLLAKEATPQNPGGRSITSYQRDALSQMWRLLIQCAVVAVQKRSRGKAKFTAVDCSLPFKLLMLCDMPDELFDANTTKLAKDQIKLLFSYCMESLNDEKLLETEGIEKSMLDMLAYICNRREFIASFKPDQQIAAILEEVEKRLTLDEHGYAPEHDIGKKAAAKIFGNLMFTCQELGISMHVHLPGSIKMIATWCHQTKNDNTSEELPSILSGASILLRSNPDLAIEPLRRHGRRILSLVQKRLIEKKTQTKSSVLFSALIEYLLRHLVVCQVAGKVQGLMHGDLGELGTASLTFNNVSTILDALFQSTGTPDVTKLAHDTVYRAQLELVVRLLACEQRMYLVLSECNESEESTVDFQEQIGRQSTGDDYYRIEPFDVRPSYGVCSATIMTESPFISRIMRKLCVLVPGSIISLQDTFSPAYENESQTASQSEGMLVETQQLSNPFRDGLVAAIDGCSADKSSLLSLLHILSAAADTFPLGECWTSSTQNNWYQLPCNDSDTSESMTLNGGSADDLAVLVEVACNFLVAQGGHNASIEIRNSVLVCLHHLSIATEALTAVCSKSMLNESNLANEWRRVWTCLFQSKFSYRGLTKSTTQGSPGDLVLRLLTQIVRFACTDPASRVSDGSDFDSFALKRQSDIWSLPVFERFDIQAPSAFMLIHAVLYGCGLSEEGCDTIGRSVSGSELWLSRMEKSGGGRRSKLVCFCLHFLEKSGEVWKDDELVAIVSACITALVNGASPPPQLVFFLPSGEWSASLALPHDTPFTCLADTTVFPTQATGPKASDVFSCLWSPPLVSPNNLVAPIDDALDVVRGGRMKILRQACERERRRKDANTIGKSVSNRVFMVASSALAYVVSQYLGTNDGEDATMKVPCSACSLAVKSYLTLMLTCDNELGIASFESVIDGVSLLFRETSSNMSSLCLDQDELAALLLDLIRIERALVLANAKLGLHWPDSIVDSSRALYKTCEALLNDYVAGDIHIQMESSLSSSKQQKKEPEDGLFEDDENSDIDNSSPAGAVAGGKRKLQARQQRRRQRRRSSDNALAWVSQRCCCLVAALFLDLNPSYKDCEFVAKTLLGVDELREDDASEYDIDTMGGVYAVELLCTETMVARTTPIESIVVDSPGEQEAPSSVASLICRIIRLIRHFSGAHSACHLFGYSYCAEIVRFRDQSHHSVPLDREEALNVIELLVSNAIQTQERRSLLLRPQLRVLRLKAATSAFRNAGLAFHSEFDKEFANVFVSPSLSDLQSCVRREASVAVAAALAILEKEKVVESVCKKLAPISSREGNHMKKYKSWYKRKNDSSSTGENQLWEDAYRSILHDVIKCWSVIAEASSGFLQQVLFDVMRLTSARRDLEAICFQCFDGLAIAVGYGSVEQLIDAEARNLTRRWIDGSLRLFDMPLLMTAPFLCRRSLVAGTWLRFSADQDDDDDDEAHPWRNYEVLKDTATKSFLLRFGDYALPEIVLLSVSTLIQSSVTKDGRRRLLEDDLLKEFCSVYFVNFDDEVAKRVIETKLYSILAAGCFTDPNVVDGLIRLLKGLLTDAVVKQKCEKDATLALRQVVKRIGDEPASENRASDSMQTLFEILGNKALQCGGDLLDLVGSSATELLLLSRFRLDMACTPKQMVQRWNSVEAILQLVIERVRARAGEHFQVNFCLQTLLTIVVNKRLAPVRLHALRWLKAMVEAAATALQGSRTSTNEELSTSVRDLFGTVFDIHQESQCHFVATCKSAQLRHDIFFRRRPGILAAQHERGDNPEDAWGWTQSDSASLSAVLHGNRSHVTKDVVDCLVATFDILQVVIENGEVLGVKDDVVACIRYEHGDEELLATLSQVQPSFVAQHLISGDLEQAPGTEREQKDNILAMLSRLSSRVSSSQTFVRAELARIERFLFQSRVKPSISEDATLSDIQQELLIEVLARFSSRSVPPETSVAASRCLGEIELPRHSMEVISPVAAEPTVLFEVGNLPKAIHVKIIEALAGCLRTSDSRKGLVAIDTLKSILASPVGKDYRKLIVEISALSALEPLTIEPLVQKAPKPLANLRLTSWEVDQIRLRYPMGKTNKDGWCWDDSLWLEGSCERSSFDSWICRIVPALLVCCYGKKTSPRSSENKFLSVCQRMSCLDSSFAIALFPAIILDLIMETVIDPEEDLDRILNDTWIGRRDSSANVRISHCIGVLLTNSTSESDQQAVDLVVDLIDLLRRLTQERFLASANFQTKVTLKRPLQTEDTPFSEFLEIICDDAESAVPWRGLPFGVVLALDGTIVVKACIQARRFEAALFYAELFAEARFGGFSCSEDVLALNGETREQLGFVSTRDISGFGKNHQLESDKSISMESDVMIFLASLRSCFAELRELDARKAVDRLESDFSFENHRSALARNPVLSTDSPSIQHLQLLDNLSQLDNQSGNVKLLVADCLDGLGVHSTLETYISGLAESASECLLRDNVLRDKFFECRLYGAQWNDSLYQTSSEDTMSPTTRLLGMGGKAGYYELLVGALQAFRFDDLETSRVRFQAARTRFLETMPSFGTKQAIRSNIPDTIDHLRTLNDLEDCVAASSGSTVLLMKRFKLVEEEEASVETIGSAGRGSTSFSNCVREVALRSALSKPSAPAGLSEILVLHLERQFETHIDGGRLKAAEGALQRLYKEVRPQCDSFTTGRSSMSTALLRLRLREATLFECQGDFSGGIRLAKLVIQYLQRKEDRDLRESSDLANALTMCGKWMAKHKVEPVNLILANYLQPAVSIYDNHNGKAGRATEALLAQSQLAANLFDSLSARVSSSQWQEAGSTLADYEQKEKALRRSVETLRKPWKSLSKAMQDDGKNPVTRDYKAIFREHARLTKEIAVTRTERINILHATEEHRILAMQSITAALSIAGVGFCEDLSKHVYRLVALWFSSDATTERWVEIDRTMEGAVEKVPTYLFVPLLAQLLSRLEAFDSKPPSFQNRLQNLLRKVALQHPYHCLVQLLTLSRGNSTRNKAACSVLQKLRTDDPTEFTGELIDSHKILSDAYLHLVALASEDIYRIPKISFSKCGKEASTRLDQCLGTRRSKRKFPPCIFTKPPTLRPGYDYGDGLEDPLGSERVDTFEATFSFASGGASRPKVVVCIGSQGGKYKQLVKGEDDMRQDAVMEQVFGYVNDLMVREQRNSAGHHQAQHSLRLVTYNCIPLSHDAGVLEWVEHAIPIKDFITTGVKNDSGAHRRYFPGELTHRRCMEIFKKVRTLTTGTGKQKKPVLVTKKNLAQTLEVLFENFSPVFRFFFLEKFGHSPEAWHESKMRYTRSVAVSSMVGHVLGIGDRHLSNIMIHQLTGEVIHIDFGIVFEQGRVLPFPELIPFRLTRNIIDGMGPLGIEGTFMKTCETTMTALKQNRSGLLTILSSIVSDPLYKWKVEPATESGGDGDGNAVNVTAVVQNEKAARTIARIHEKLQGYEDGTSGEQQSVESQVQLLVSAARDIDNLCQIYFGWAPWM